MNNSFTKIIFNTNYYEFNHQNLFEPFVAQSSKSLLLLIKMFLKKLRLSYISKIHIIVKYNTLILG